MIIQLETENPDKTLSWSTMKNYNTLLEDKIRTPSIQVCILNYNTSQRAKFQKVTYFNVPRFHLYSGA